jgi:hypothetical protein
MERMAGIPSWAGAEPAERLETTRRARKSGFDIEANLRAREDIRISRERGPPLKSRWGARLQGRYRAEGVVSVPRLVVISRL